MAARHCDGTSPTCPLASRSALARGFSREGAKSTGHGRTNSARPLGQVNSCRSQPVDGPPPLSCGSSWASQSGPRLTLWLGPLLTTQKILKVCGRPDLLAPQRYSPGVYREPCHGGTSHTGIKAGRCAPPANYTTQDAVVLGGQAVLETPRAGHPR